MGSTSTGNTETVAGYLAAESGLEAVMIDDLDGAGVAAFDGFIIGAPTWNTGADEERSGTAWDEFLYGDLKELDLKGKKVAVFAVGDQGGYADNFCDAVDELHSCFTGQGAESIGMSRPRATSTRRASRSATTSSWACPLTRTTRPTCPRPRACPSRCASTTILAIGDQAIALHAYSCLFCCH